MASIGSAPYNQKPLPPERQKPVAPVRQKPGLARPEARQPSTVALDLQRTIGNAAFVALIKPAGPTPLSASPRHGQREARSVPVIRRSCEESDSDRQALQDEQIQQLRLLLALSEIDREIDRQKKLERLQQQSGGENLDKETEHESENETPGSEKQRRTESDPRRKGGGRVKPPKKSYRYDPYRDGPPDIWLQRKSQVTGANNGRLLWNAGFTSAPKNNPRTPSQKDFGPVTAKNSSTYSHNKSLHLEQPGGPVGDTRPNDWSKFRDLVPPFVGSQRELKFPQGHNLHQQLGGTGAPDNLAPFTASLNACHERRAESQVISFANGQRQVGYVDYDVDMNYGGNTTSIKNRAKAQWASVVAADTHFAIGALKAASLITVPQGGNYLRAGAIPANKVNAANNWLDNYVGRVFPASISIDAKFVQPDAHSGYERTDKQHLDLTNEI